MERSREECFLLEYVAISSDSNSFAIRFSSSSYVDPPSVRVLLAADTHHPRTVPKKRSEKEFGRAGRIDISRMNSNGQPSVATMNQGISTSEERVLPKPLTNLK